MLKIVERLRFWAELIIMLISVGPISSAELLQLDFTGCEHKFCL